ncbi:MAG: ABC transporter ATP-binding protein [Desulfomonile tiedjei]|uniref:ABC transporter ATP-binding protein n=1 Tax=Desulfomonile tiedjei TaxID=2358 RepID=A0A9D6V6Y1_9BACT|nr:ABC transporter ATP-binding protein [Desulfomonile tiedjei]
MADDGYLLELKNVSKSFGGLVALDGISYGVQKGEILGIIGPNGAGKTTLFNVITGEQKPTGGRVYLKGEDITGLPPDIICQKGMSRTFQLTFIFPEMTVFESVWIGVYSRFRRPWNLFFSRADRLGTVAEKALHIIRTVGLEQKMREIASNLSYGDQKVLEIAMALSTDPVMLLLDEPTQGVGPGEVDTIINLVERLSKEMSIILIEHDMDIVARLCHNVTVLSFGKTIARGSCEVVSQNEEVQRIYLGEKMVCS